MLQRTPPAGPSSTAEDPQDRFFIDATEAAGDNAMKSPGTRFEPQLRTWGHSGFGQDHFGFDDRWYVGGASLPGIPAGGSDRNYATFAATYRRDHARGTAVLHVSMEPSYATLTVVEDVER